MHQSINCPTCFLFFYIFTPNIQQSKRKCASLKSVSDFLLLFICKSSKDTSKLIRKNIPMKWQKTNQQKKKKTVWGANILFLENILWQNSRIFVQPLLQDIVMMTKEYVGFFFCFVFCKIPPQLFSCHWLTVMKSHQISGLCKPCSLYWWSYYIWTRTNCTKKKIITEYISDWHGQIILKDSVYTCFCITWRSSELKIQCESDRDCCFQPTWKGCLNHTVHSKSVSVKCTILNKG